MHTSNGQLFPNDLNEMAEERNEGNSYESIHQEGIKKYGNAYVLSRDKLVADRNIVLEAVKKNGKALEHADKSLINDASFFWQIWNIQKSKSGDEYRKVYINRYLLKETAKILLGAGLTGFSYICVDSLFVIMYIDSKFLASLFLLSIPALYIGAIYTFYKVAEHGYGFFKAKYELSTSETDHAFALNS
jgi:hypothetical protein